MQDVCLELPGHTVRKKIGIKERFIWNLWDSNLYTFSFIELSAKKKKELQDQAPMASSSLTNVRVLGEDEVVLEHQYNVRKYGVYLMCS